MIEKMRCPQCGGRARIGKERAFFDPLTGETSFSFFVWCPNCNLKTKKHITAREAAEAWRNGVYEWKEVGKDV